MTRRRVAPLAALVLLALLPAASTRAQTLREVVEAERAIVEREADVLAAEVQALEGLLQRERARQEADARRLSTDITHLQTRIDARRRTLRELSREVPNSPGHADPDAPEPDTLAALLHDMRAELGAHGMPLPDAPPSIGQLEQAFTAFFDVLRFENQVRQEPAAVFTPDGRLHPDGTVLRIGRVAAFGWTGALAGPVVPADARTWVMIQGEPADAWQGLREGSASPPVPVRLFEDVDDTIRRVQPQARSLLQQAGPLAWPLVLLAAAAALVVLVKTLSLLRLGAVGRAESLADAVARGPAAVLQAAPVHQLDRIVQAAARRVAAEGEVRDARWALQIEVETLQALTAMQRGLGALKVLAATAPLMGLLGTVSGMIRTFEVIRVVGTGNAQSLSGGIAEALVTTEIGLWIAIPSVLLHTALAGWVDSRATRLHAEAATLVSRLQPDPQPASEPGDD
jgi:biopolymer transport protein ExbB